MIEMSKDSNLALEEGVIPEATDLCIDGSSSPPVMAPLRVCTTINHNKSSDLLRKVFPKRRPNTFHNFSDLPKELRLMIWETAIPLEGRVHELHPCAKLLEDGKMMFRSNRSTPPSLLHVNNESRYIALQNYKLMDYSAPSASKGIRKFYFNPRCDTLFLNTLMGLYMAFMLLENSTGTNYEGLGRGVMKGWQNVALDADRVQLLDMLAGVRGHTPRPRLQEVFPDLKQFIVAFDYTTRGKTRFRTSVWPGENGTSLKIIHETTPNLDAMFSPIVQFTRQEYSRKARESEEDGEGEVPDVVLAFVKRKRYLRGDIRYGFRKTCGFLHIKPPGFLMRI